MSDQYVTSDFPTAPRSRRRCELEALREERAAALRGATKALDARRAHLAALQVIDSEIETIEAAERASNLRRRIANAKVANSIYRDGEPRESARHCEIAGRYAWAQQPRREPMRRGSRSLVALLRLCELERLWSVRYGGELPNDDGGQDDLWIAAQLIRRRRGDVAAKIVQWARVWAPWCGPQEAAALAAHVIAHPFEFSADTLAEKVGLAYAERLALGITTIGAIDADLAERTRRRRARARAKEREQRRASGVQVRAEYEAQSISRTKPWEALGISRRTWYRQQERERLRAEFAADMAAERVRDREAEGLAEEARVRPRGAEPQLSKPADWEGVPSLWEGCGGDRGGENVRGTGLRSAGFEEASAGRRPVPGLSRGDDATAVSRKPLPPSRIARSRPLPGGIWTAEASRPGVAESRGKVLLMADSYYKTKAWLSLRKAALRRDLYTCVVPGCGQPAYAVDHVKRRRDGGADTLDNLRSLCTAHDHAVKEGRDGKRGNQGKLVVKGCFADGTPRDPSHPWFTGGRVQSSEPNERRSGGVPPRALTSD